MTTIEAISYGLLILLITTWVGWLMGKHHDRHRNPGITMNLGWSPTPVPRPPSEPATPTRGHEHPPA